jgi:hypothetical protein
LSVIEEIRCGDCGHLFPEGVFATQIPRSPCPQCGSTRRTGTVLESISLGVGVSAHGSATFDRTWRSQYRRMMRCLAKLHGATPPTNVFIAAEIEDGFMAFFQAAWHLKDWLKADPQSSRHVSDIETFVNSTPELCLVADLANGTKHLALDRRPRTGDASTGMLTMSFGGDPTVGLCASIAVTSNGHTHDALGLALSAVNCWELYLASKGLQV